MPDRRWLVLGLLALVRIAMGIQFQSIGAVGPALVSGLGLDYATLGTLAGAYLLPGAAMALPAGWLTARLGDRPTVLGGLALMAAGGVATGTPLWIGGTPTSAGAQPYNLQITGSIFYTSTPNALSACTKATAAQSTTK